MLIIGSGISGLVAASSLQHFGGLERMVQFTPLVFWCPCLAPLCRTMIRPDLKRMNVRPTASRLQSHDTGSFGPRGLAPQAVSNDAQLIQRWTHTLLTLQVEIVRVN